MRLSHFFIDNFLSYCGQLWLIYHLANLRGRHDHRNSSVEFFAFTSVFIICNVNVWDRKVPMTMHKAQQIKCPLSPMKTPARARKALCRLKTNIYKNW